MPTMGKLVAAVLFGVLFAFASTIIADTYLKTRLPPWFYQINIGFAVVLGWRIAGSRAGRGFAPAVSYGVTSVIMICVCALLLHGGIEMFLNTRDLKYDGPMEAVVGVIEEGIDFAVAFYSPRLVAVLAVGSIAAALVTDWIGKRTT